MKAHHRFSGDVGPKRDCLVRTRDLPLSVVVHCGILSFYFAKSILLKNKHNFVLKQIPRIPLVLLSNL